MKRLAYLSVIAVIVMSIMGCTTPQGRRDYTATGALTGALVGSLTRHPGPGALVGAVIGGIIGHGMDQAQEAQLRAQAPQTLQRVENGQPLTVEDVQSLVKAGISDDLIISQIRNSRTVYRLTTADIIALKNAGVSEKIIDFMINTPTQIPYDEVSGVVGPLPPPPPPQQIVVAPGPDYVWVEGVWLWLGSRWIWHHGYWHQPKDHRHKRR